MRFPGEDGERSAEVTVGGGSGSSGRCEVDQIRDLGEVHDQP